MITELQPAPMVKDAVAAGVDEFGQASAEGVIVKAYTSLATALLMVIFWVVAKFTLFFFQTYPAAFPPLVGVVVIVWVVPAHTCVGLILTEGVDKAFTVTATLALGLSQPFIV